MYVCRERGREIFKFLTFRTTTHQSTHARHSLAVRHQIDWQIEVRRWNDARLLLIILFRTCRRRFCRICIRLRRVRVGNRVSLLSRHRGEELIALRRLLLLLLLLVGRLLVDNSTTRRAVVGVGVGRVVALLLLLRRIPVVVLASRLMNDTSHRTDRRDTGGGGFLLRRCCCCC